MEAQENDYKQFQRVQIELFREPQTAMQIAKSVGCDRANVTWYIRDLRKAGKVWKTHTGQCPITKHRHVGFYTTNIEFVPNLPKHPTLF